MICTHISKLSECSGLSSSWFHHCTSPYQQLCFGLLVTLCISGFNVLLVECMGQIQVDFLHTVPFLLHIKSKRCVRSKTRCAQRSVVSQRCVSAVSADGLFHRHGYADRIIESHAAKLPVPSHWEEFLLVLRKSF